MFKFVYGRDWITKLFLALLAFSFVIGTAIMWGPGGLNFGFGNYVLKVGDIAVSPKEFILEINRLKNQYPNLNKEQLKNAALNNLLLTTLFAYLAERDGFFVSKEEIKAFIERQFSEKGKFNSELFQRYLQMLKMTPKEFEESLRKTLLANKYKTAVYSTSYINDKVFEASVLPFTLKLKVKVGILSYKNFENLFKPTEEELKEFYKQVEKNFLEEIPERVEVYSVKTEEELKELYRKLKEGEKISQKPIEVVGKENLNKTEGAIKELAEKVLRDKTIAVQKTKEGYLIGVYIPSTKRVPNFEEVKEKVAEIYKQLKALEYLKKHKGEILKAVKEGKYKPTWKEMEISAYELMEKFNLTTDDIFSIFAGKRELVAVVPQGLAIIEVLSVSEEKLQEGIAEYFKLSVRNSDYLRKLQEVVNYVLKHQEVQVEVNRKLLERF